MLPLAADDPPPQAMGRVSFDAEIPGHDAARCGGRRNDGGACTEKPRCGITKSGVEKEVCDALAGRRSGDCFACAS